MNIKFLAPIGILGVIFLLRQEYDGLHADALGVDRGSSDLALTQFLGSSGVVDLSPEKTIIVEDPEDLRKVDLYGWETYHPGVAGAGDAIHVLDQVIAGHPGRKSKPQRPADYRMLAHANTCAPRAPSTGERVVNASIGQSLVPTDLHAYSEAEMAEDTQKWLSAHYQRPRSVSEKGIVRDHQVPVVDLVLTDTSAPLYLILQNRARSVLWNIHTAPGVTVSHIVTVGPKTVALNPPPGEFGIEMLRSGIGCVPDVARQPQSWWNVFTKLERERKDAYRDADRARIDRARDALFTRHEAYDAWFRAAFGFRSEDGVIGFDTTHFLLAGPAPTTPEARVPYRPIQNSTVLVSAEDYIFAAPEKDRVGFMMELQRDFIATAAGGSIDALYPEPMQRAVQ